LEVLAIQRELHSWEKKVVIEGADEKNIK
jgi:hypothetical protein